MRLLAGLATDGQAVYEARTTTPIPALTAIAQRYTGDMHRPTATVIGAAQAELHALTTLVDTTAR